MMEPKLHHKDAFKLAGIETRTSNSLEMDQGTARIPQLWGRFFQEGVLSQLPGGDSPAGITTVYTAYDGDDTAPYSLIIGCVVKDAVDAIPSTMTVVDVPEQDYLEFTGKGAIPEVVIQTWQAVWTYFHDETSYERSYVADFEEYPAGGSEVQIFIGVHRLNNSAPLADHFS